MLGWGILGAIAWIIIAIIPAKIASSKGRGFWGWFLLSLFFWWITLFIALFLKDEKSPHYGKIGDEEE